MFVCLYVPYTNPHFWTDRNQTLHTSPPRSGRDRKVCMGPQYFTFPTFSTYFVEIGCPCLCSSRLPAPHCTAAALYPRAGVTSRTVGCAMKTRRSERNACVWKWKPDETGWKWLMNWTCNCIAVIQMITYNLSNLRPSFFRSLSTDNTFFHLNLSRRSARCFANGMTTQCCQPWQSRVCLCRKPLCLYTFFDLLALFRPFWQMFRERHDSTVIHASHMGNCMLHARESETPQTFTFRLLKGKQRTSVTFQPDGNIPISLHVFAFLLIIEQDIVLIRDAAFFLHVCAFA